MIPMKTQLIAAVTALALATAAPALAGDGWNHHHHWNGNGWVGPFVGGLAGAAIIGSVLAAPPYYGYGGYGYAPYYSYPTLLVPPQPRWCQGPYGTGPC